MIIKEKAKKYYSDFYKLKEDHLNNNGSLLHFRHGHITDYLARRSNATLQLYFRWHSYLDGFTAAGGNFSDAPNFLTWLEQEDF